MLIIGIAGGSGSGKTTVVNRMIELLPRESVSVIAQDSYYWDNGHLPAEDKKLINFDHPDSIEWALLIRHLDHLRDGHTIDIPTYSYVECSRLDKTIRITPRPVTIIEGILIFTNAELRSRCNIKVFVDADDDDRLSRIMRRDIIDRGRNVQDVLRHYHTFVKPMHLQFIEPSKRYADIIVPQGGENHVAIDILASKVKTRLS
ncbi:MAG TPA: uridine kinase, partial [Bacteroidales bacterium]|nr:uridine kinase [Bacteroidales bacterium]